MKLAGLSPNNENVTYSGDWARARKIQEIRHKSGDALRGHQESQHAGKFDITCNACAELERKMEGKVDVFKRKRGR